MKDRIADEINRSDLTTQIGYAIKSAIKVYDKNRFWFNESRSFTFSTVDGQEFYTSSDNANIPNLLAIDTVQIAVASTDKYLLERVSYEQMEAVSSNGTTDEGQPTWFCYFGKQLRLYPIPDAVYTIRVSGHWALDDLSATADTNAWMTDGEILIRSRAKRELYTHVIRDADGAAAMAQAEVSELKALQSASSMRGASGMLEAMEF
jgi:hypothetical protein